jgi:hypothetical protein
MGTTEDISVNTILDEGLPAGATGVHWTSTDWTECPAHLMDESWAQAVERSDEAEGVVLYGDVDCDACDEQAKEDATDVAWELGT